ncbi:G5 domain-containing protein [Micromonosporaceae bacterium Da 78-11]
MPQKSWWARLPFGVRMTAGTSALLLLIGGGVAGVAALTGNHARTVAESAVPAGPPAGVSTGGGAAGMTDEVPPRPLGQDVPGLDPAATVPRTSDRADRTVPRNPSRVAPGSARANGGPAGVNGGPAGVNGGPAGVNGGPADANGGSTGLSGGSAVGGAKPQTRQGKAPAVASPHQAPAPPAPVRVKPAPAPAAADPLGGHPVVPPRRVVTTRTAADTRPVAFRTQLVADPTLVRGIKRVRTQGSPGVQTLRYLITLTNGKQTARRLLDTKVTRKPQNRIVAFGTLRDFDFDYDRDRLRDPDRLMDCGQNLGGMCVPFSRGVICPDLADDLTSATLDITDLAFEESAAEANPAKKSKAEDKDEESTAEDSAFDLGAAIILSDRRDQRARSADWPC